MYIRGKNTNLHFCHVTKISWLSSNILENISQGKNSQQRSERGLSVSIVYTELLWGGRSMTI